MFRQRPDAAFALSAVVAALAAAAAAAGLAVDGLYRDNPFVSAGWRGNDWVTLVVAAPVLAGAARLARRGDPRAQLVWLGALDAVLYNFAFYLFGSALNRLFVVYAAIVALALAALLIALVAVDPAALGRRVRWGRATRAAAGFALFVAAGLGVAELAQVLGYAFGGALPVVVARTGHPTHVVAALDLTLVVPYLALGGVLLWRRRPWGVVVAAMLLVKGAIYMLALVATTLSILAVGFPEAAAELPLWAAIGAGCAATAWGVVASVDGGREERGEGGAV